jgi:WD40 repeat protein
VIDMYFDATGRQIALLVEDGTVLTVEAATGEIIAEVDSESTSPIIDIGIRDDGLYTLTSQGRVELLDPRTGPVGRGFDLDSVESARLLPDGRLLTHTSAGDSRLYDLESNPLVEQSLPTAVRTQISFNAGLAGSLPVTGGEPEVIELATGTRTPVELTDEDGTVLRPMWVYPERDGYWVISIDGVFARWADGELVERFEIDREIGTGTRFGDRIAVVTVDGPLRASTVDVIDLTPGSAGVKYTVVSNWPISDDEMVATAHPAVDGGVHVLDFDGRMRTYDAAGELVGTLETGAEEVRVITMDATTGQLALADATDGDVVLVDPSNGEVVVLQTNDNAANLGWARNGELLVITSFDGSIRLWDVARGEPGGVMYRGSGAFIGSPSFYDDTTDSIWVSTSGQLVQLPLSADTWIERACAITARDLTQEEWDRLVPGGGPVQSGCA